MFLFFLDLLYIRCRVYLRCVGFFVQMLLILLGVLLIIRLVFVDGPGYFPMFLAALCFGAAGCSESSMYAL